MRYIFILLLGLVFFMGSCKKENKTDAIAAIPNGTYTGTFQRTGGPVSNVTIMVSGSDWSGQSQTHQYPALCEGSYTSTVEGDIVFTNACAWTANFDWTLILGGEFDFTMSGRDIELVKGYSGGMQDVYKLTRQ